MDTRKQITRIKFYQELTRKDLTGFAAEMMAELVGDLAEWLDKSQVETMALVDLS